MAASPEFVMLMWVGLLLLFWVVGVILRETMRDDD
jgi:hypothetical protein